MPILVTYVHFVTFQTGINQVYVEASCCGFLINDIFTKHRPHNLKYNCKSTNVNTLCHTISL
jgi:hypothetical protein